jgi:microcompartment protein CcmL/EutN
MIETRGLTPLFEATDAMLKAANVELIGWEKINKVSCRLSSRARWPR